MEIISENGVTIRLLHVVEDENDDNIDAIVRIPGEETRTVTFFTLKSIASIIERHESNGECLSGTFFWAIDFVIVKNLRLETIEATVLEMIRTGEHAKAWRTVHADGATDGGE